MIKICAFCVIFSVFQVVEVHVCQLKPVDGDVEWSDRVSDTHKDSLEHSLLILLKNINGLVPDCSNSSVSAMKLLWSCSQPSVSCYLMNIVMMVASSFSN